MLAMQIIKAVAVITIMLTVIAATNVAISIIRINK